MWENDPPHLGVRALHVVVEGLHISTETPPVGIKGLAEDVALREGGRVGKEVRM